MWVSESPGVFVCHGYILDEHFCAEINKKKKTLSNSWRNQGRIFRISIDIGWERLVSTFYCRPERGRHMAVIGLRWTHSIGSLGLSHWCNEWNHCSGWKYHIACYSSLGILSISCFYPDKSILKKSRMAEVCSESFLNYFFFHKADESLFLFSRQLPFVLSIVFHTGVPSGMTCCYFGLSIGIIIAHALWLSLETAGTMNRFDGRVDRTSFS